MKVEIPNGFTNDNLYLCGDCGAKSMCFLDEGSTDFCPNCGSRSLEMSDT